MTPVVYDYDSASPVHPMYHELMELVRYRDLVRQLVVRNIRVRYKRSILGVAWSMLGPLLTMAALSLVFTRAFRPLTPNYPIYLFPGLLIWGFFAQATSSMAAEVIGGVELWKRVYTPRTAFAAATLCTSLVHLAFAMVPLMLLMLAFGMPFGPGLAALPVVVLATALFTLGVGLALSALAGYFADVADLYSVLLATWMYVTPIIYPASILPADYRWIVRLNPMTYFVEGFRAPIYGNTFPPPAGLAAMCALAVSSLLCGWWLFTRSADDLVRRA
ncbi:MAG TPA: ABC transporter permease [Vicinamibacterales bacterium]|jgi:ABC-2 type transport system permease protein|nr:ABC transporter permease [Vicinamibacterales bacterium]